MQAVVQTPGKTSRSLVLLCGTGRYVKCDCECKWNVIEPKNPVQQCSVFIIWPIIIWPYGHDHMAHNHMIMDHVVVKPFQVIYFHQ